jgi:hypothetical protein
MLPSHRSHAHVEVNVTRVGFPTLQLGQVVRSGAWVPVIVDLSLVNQHSFDGTVRVSQFDNDGDQCYDAVGVHLLEGARESQRVFLYIPANTSRNQGRFLVEVFDEEGEIVRVVCQGALTLQASGTERPSVITDDDVLILSISTGAIGRVQDLVGLDQRDIFERTVHVAHMSPTDLPELWLGLEVVDYIVWENARPEALTPRQTEALLSWVRRGGTLLIAAAQSAASLRLSEPIRRVLPAELGDLAVVEDLPQVRRRLLGVVQGDDPGFPEPVQIVGCTLRPDARRVPDRSLHTSNLISRRREGRGSVIFCGVTLNDLFSGTGQSSEFFRKVFYLNLLENPEVGRPNPVPLFSQVVSAVAFSTSASLYLAIAGVFSVGYVVAATMGTWSLVSAKRWRQHAWSAFAVVAIAASVLAFFAVNVVRGGFTDTVHQISVVDLDAGKTYGYATAFFGVKSGTDKRVDLWLPENPAEATEPEVTGCFLRPLPSGARTAEAITSFADPTEYRLVPGSAQIEDVRIRGTLKQFGGRWEGFVQGAVDAEVSVRGRTLLAGSYIVNNLGVDLTDCYLLQSTADLEQGMGLRSRAMYAFPIGDVPADGERTELVDRCYRLAPNETTAQFLERSTLAKAQTAWGSAFRSVVANLGYGSGSEAATAVGQEQTALLLMSTVGDFDPAQDTNLAGHFLGYASWSRECLRQLDLREELARDSLVLIGFAADPGPVRLFRRTGDAAFRPLEPDVDASWTMYRIRIPTTVLRGPSELDDEQRDEFDEAAEVGRSRGS